jgi:hypothetical protein
MFVALGSVEDVGVALVAVKSWRHRHCNTDSCQLHVPCRALTPLGPSLFV